MFCFFPPIMNQCNSNRYTILIVDATVRNVVLMGLLFGKLPSFLVIFLVMFFVDGPL